MLAYHGEPAIKQKYIDRMLAHMAADELIRGVGFDANANKGCAVGCTFDAYEHERGPIEIGVPVPILDLEDAIYEELHVDEYRSFPLQVLEAIPIGADLSRVWPEFVRWVLTDSIVATVGAAEAVRIRGWYQHVADTLKHTYDDAEDFANAMCECPGATGTYSKLLGHLVDHDGNGFMYEALRQAEYGPAGSRADFGGSARDKLLQLLREAPLAIPTSHP